MKRLVRVLTVVLALCVGVSSTITPAKPAEALAPYYDHNGREGSIVRLYSAYFLRTPDAGGFNYWYMNSLAGRSLRNISNFFAQSPEFKNRYGNLGNRGFVDLVYRNVMGRNYDAGGYNYWYGRLNAGMSRGEMMAYFSDSAEYRSRTIAIVAPGWRAGSNARTLLARLPVATEKRTGYDRDLFNHWIDADRNGCHTRCEVLKAEKRRDGTWFSLWDRKTVRTESGLHIDHVVALAEAWDSGAHSWTNKKREQFANWMPNLVAVSISSNSSKSDRDAAEWQPASASRCVFAELTVNTKYYWGLSVDSAEKSALQRMLAGCTAGSTVIPPGGTPPPTTPPPTTPPPSGGCATAEIYRAADPRLCVADYERADGDVNCADLPKAAKPVRILRPGVDPYRLDGNNDGWGCTS